MRSRTLWLVVALPAIVVAAALGFQQRDPASRPDPSPFVAERAFRDLENVVGFGPRPAGSENLRVTLDYIVAELRAAGLDPVVDRFVAQTPVGAIPMTNVRVSRPGRGPETIAVAGHYDTKRYDFEFVGANDGGSSTAVLLELARISADLDLGHTLEFVFFDGEEAVRDWTASDSLYGSRYDIARRSAAGTLEDLKALILVDMVGDRDLGILQEAASTAWLRSLVWTTASRLGHGEHFGAELSLIDDDHVPYLEAGIPAIDLIDFEYPYWHTPEDTLDKTSAASLKVVGDVLYNVLPEVDRQLSGAR